MSEWAKGAAFFCVLGAGTFAVCLVLIQVVDALIEWDQAWGGAIAMTALLALGIWLTLDMLANEEYDRF